MKVSKEVQLKKFLTTMNQYLASRYPSQELELRPGTEDDFYIQLGDLVAPDLKGETPLLEAFKDNLTDKVLSLHGTYPDLVPHWEDFDSGVIRIFTNPEESF